MAVWAVLVTFRRPQALGVMLDRLREQTLPLEGLIVVDNDPTPETRLIAGQWPGAFYVAAPENLGPAGGIALGMERVLKLADDEDWVVLLDDDNPPPRPETLAELSEMGQNLFSIDPCTAGIGISVSRLHRTGRLRRVPDSSEPEPGDCIAGNMFPLYRVAAIRDVGVFDASLFFGFEELDFGLRLRAASYNLYRYKSPGHLHAQPHQSGVHRIKPLVPSKLWRRYYSLRNLVYLLRRHHRWLALLTTLARGFLRPVVAWPRNRGLSRVLFANNVHAIADGLRGRMSRTIDPYGK